MWEMLMSIFDFFVSRLEITIPILWVTFTTYVTWYFTSAKRNAPLTPKEAQILWKVHKQESQCKAKRWRRIVHKNKIIGLECKCGYRHIQKRPIV